MILWKIYTKHGIRIKAVAAVMKLLYTVFSIETYFRERR